jgi:hypothetical protein
MVDDRTKARFSQTVPTVLTVSRSEYTGAAQIGLEVLVPGAADDDAQSVVRCPHSSGWPRPCSHFTAETDLNAKHPKERLRRMDCLGRTGVFTLVGIATEDDFDSLTCPRLNSQSAIAARWFFLKPVTHLMLARRSLLQVGEALHFPPPPSHGIEHETCDDEKKREQHKCRGKNCRRKPRNRAFLEECHKDRNGENEGDGRQHSPKATEKNEGTFGAV